MGGILVSLLFGIGLLVVVVGIVAFLSWRRPHLYGVFFGAACLLFGMFGSVSTVSDRGRTEVGGWVAVLGGIGLLAGSFGFSRREPWGRPVLIWSGPLMFVSGAIVEKVSEWRLPPEPGSMVGASGGPFRGGGSIEDVLEGASRAGSSILDFVSGYQGFAVFLVILWVLPFVLTHPSRGLPAGPEDESADGWSMPEMPDDEHHDVK